jgi:flavin-dependent dehydrogenase
VDVVVVGARCAGAATAMLLASAGHEVLLLDRATFPSDTISTHVIARTGMVQLHRWGLLPAVLASGAPPVTRVEFHSEDGVLARTLKDRHGVDHLLAPRRVILDAILQQGARGAGASIATGVSVDDVVRDASGRVVGVAGHDAEGPLEVRARHVVGADGLNSRTARSVAAPFTIVRPSSGAAQYAYFEGDWSAIEYYLAADAFTGVFPTHGGAACIWACTPEGTARDYRTRHGSPEQALAALLDDAAPALGERVRAATRTSPVRGMLRMPNHLRQPFGDGWALVGDAGYHRDAITGYGISDAFRDAELLAATLDDALRDPTREADALAAYGRERDRMAREIFEITCELASFPEKARFVELQKQLALAIDDQAGELAARPLPRVAEFAA